jgi:YVTN family beta-propeller protein
LIDDCLIPSAAEAIEVRVSIFSSFPFETNLSLVPSGETPPLLPLHQNLSSGDTFGQRVKLSPDGKIDLHVAQGLAHLSISIEGFWIPSDLSDRYYTKEEVDNLIAELSRSLSIGRSSTREVRGSQGEPGPPGNQGPGGEPGPPGATGPQGPAAQRNRMSLEDIALLRWDRDPGRPGVISVGNEPDGIAFDGTFIWVANAVSNTVSKIDPASNVVVATVDVEESPVGVAFDGAYIWVTNHVSNSVSKIDPVSS